MSAVNGYSFNISTPFKLLQSLTPGATSNSTSEVKLLSMLVPANTFAAGDIVRIESAVKKVGITSGQTLRFYWNTADSISSPTPITLGYDTRAASNLVIPLIRHLSIATSDGSGNGTYTYTTNTGAGAQQDIAATVAFSPESKAINWTADGYLIIAGAVTSSSDTITAQFFRAVNG